MGLFLFQRRGLSLVEVLVVVSLLAVLAGMITPAVISSREAARAITCTSNLRQLGAAMRMYCDDEGGRPPGLWSLTPAYADAKVLQCPNDGWLTKGGWAWSRFGLLERPTLRWPVAVSYAFPFTRDVSDPMWWQSEGAVGRSGFAACLLHGKAVPHSEILLGEAPHYAGEALRLCWDGSVVVRHFPKPSFDAWSLLTDDPSRPDRENVGEVK
jgi:prepilin-type N-terminal cleavage/methylation domain-containing protein